MKKDFSNVFAAHPKAQKLYVVKGVPFLKEVHAKNYAHEKGLDIEVVKRPTENPEQTEGTDDGQPGASKSGDAKEAADATKKATTSKADPKKDAPKK